ncbi:hypothetical protein [Salibacterium lacus]|uniref:XRE family transcriptional regulator n=1 Tax=Salibacterium lacus TaxID=1898109 RepID=A0ABW5SWI1_9BACI
MQNKPAKARLYNPSAIPKILQTARERAIVPEHRTKRWLSEYLGITLNRLTNVENGTAQAPLELCVEWCEAVKDEEAQEQIEHIYGLSLPPTDPRLLENVTGQLANFETELEEAKIAAEEIRRLSQRYRPWTGFTSRDIDVLQENVARQILDIQHAADCLLTSMKRQWGLNLDYVEAQWINKAISNNVIMHRVSDYEALRKRRTDQERMMQLGGHK